MRIESEGSDSQLQEYLRDRHLAPKEPCETRQRGSGFTHGEPGNHFFWRKGATSCTLGPGWIAGLGFLASELWLCSTPAFGFPFWLHSFVSMVLFWAIGGLEDPCTDLKAQLGFSHRLPDQDRNRNPQMDDFLLALKQPPKAGYPKHNYPTASSCHHSRYSPCP